jgi:hypothetical protein
MALKKYPTKTGRTFHRTAAIFILAILEIMPRNRKDLHILGRKKIACR